MTLTHGGKTALMRFFLAGLLAACQFGLLGRSWAFIFFFPGGMLFRMLFSLLDRHVIEST